MSEQPTTAAYLKAFRKELLDSDFSQEESFALTADALRAILAEESLVVKR